MGAVEVTLFMVGAGLSFLAARLGAKKVDQKDNWKFDDAPTTLASRGSYIPLIYGEQRVRPIFAWAGERKAIERTLSRFPLLGGGSGGAGEGKVRVYQEAAWHILSVGPVAKLSSMLYNGKEALLPRVGSHAAAVSPLPLTPAKAPSGSTVFVYGLGNFDIYWGESDQPINDALGDNIGIYSQWPNVAYIYWNLCLIGSSAVWPTIEYDIGCEGTGIHEALPGSSPSLGYGVNPAHLLWNLISAPWPWGCGVDTSKLDRASFEAAAIECTLAGLAFSMSTGDGDTGTQKVGEILQDLGAMLSPFQLQHFLLLVREGAKTYHLGADSLTPPEPELEFLFGDEQNNRLVFTYKDRTKGWRDSDIQVDDEANVSERFAWRTKRISIPSTVSHSTAQSIANRRQLEELAGVLAYKIEATRAARGLRPGQRVLLDDLGFLRIINTQIDGETGTVKLEAVVDYYGVTESLYSSAAPIMDPVQPRAEEDFFVSVIELPWDLSKNVLAAGIARIRAHALILGADVYTSLDDSAYAFATQATSYGSGGTILSRIAPGACGIIEYGPEFTVEGEDIANVLDLSSDEYGWRTGTQLAIIGEEIFFLRNIVVTSGTTFQLRGLIRARLNTTKGTHEIGDHVVIIPQETLAAIAGLTIFPVANYYTKSVPWTETAISDIDNMTSFNRPIRGLGLIPLSPGNFRANGSSDGKYISGNDVILTWSARVRDGLGGAAGEQVAGAAVAAQPDREGTFEVVITGGRVLTITGINCTVTYTNAEIVSDFGTPPAIIEATIINKVGAYSSLPITTTVTRV